jgi:predicted glycoside hydrolase/deacetylase ChbG (UPF0249 family)
MGVLHPQLEIFADDYGISTGVTEAILTAAEAGQLDAISVMKPQQPARLLRLRACRPVEVGMHWAPIGGGAPYTTLASLTLQAFLGRVDRAALAQHFANQLAQFRTELGFAPDFVDSHQHIHQLPQVRALFEELLKRHGLECVRSTHRPRVLSKGWGKRQVLSSLGKAYARTRNFPAICLTLDYSQMDPEKTARFVAEQLASQPTGETLQLIVHPGLAADPELKAFDPLWRDRDKDARLLEALSRQL